MEGEKGCGGAAIKLKFGDKRSGSAKTEVVTTRKRYCGGLRGRSCNALSVEGLFEGKKGVEDVGRRVCWGHSF